MAPISLSIGVDMAKKKSPRKALVSKKLKSASPVGAGVVRKAARVSRSKRTSDDIYNARRALRRDLDRLERRYRDDPERLQNIAELRNSLTVETTQSTIKALYGSMSKEDIREQQIKGFQTVLRQFQSAFGGGGAGTTAIKFLASVTQREPIQSDREFKLQLKFGLQEETYDKSKVLEQGLWASTVDIWRGAKGEDARLLRLKDYFSEQEGREVTYREIYDMYVERTKNAGLYDKVPGTEIPNEVVSELIRKALIFFR